MSRLSFSCQVADFPADTFEVAEFELDEGLSELFTLTVSLVSHRDDIVLDDQLMRSARLTITIDGEEQRTISGLIEGAERGDSDFRRTFYTLTIRPKMWRLALNQESRIFHFQTVPEILQTLLKKHDIHAQSQLNSPHQQRDYITQKRESDYAFFCRLAAEEGISFWFEKEGMFYADSHLGMTAGIALLYNSHPQPATREAVVHALRLGAFMRPEEVIHKDRAYPHPRYRLTHRAQMPGRRQKETQYSVFESYGRFQDDANGEPFTRYRLEALRADAVSGRAESNCIKLMPGKIFEIKEHPVPSVNDSWQVVAIHHHGQMPQVLQQEGNASERGATLTNTMTFIPGRLDWRPPFRHKPLADGDEVATVVGPADEEIYVNETG